MEDLGQQLNQILSDPNAMEQIQGMLGSLGLGQNSPAPAQTPAPAPQGNNPLGNMDLSALSGLIGSLGGTGAAPPANPLGGAGLNPEMIQTFARLAPLLSKTQQETDSTRLLMALRPLLGQERQKKVDESIKILQMMQLLPLLKESGIFSGLLSGLL